MRRLGSFVLVVLAFGFSVSADCAAAEEPSPADFQGAWLGEIVAPNTRATFGLAFTPLGSDLLVSLYFPDMFLYSANFGVARFRDGAFVLDALHLKVSRKGAGLSGVFGLAELPVELSRGTAFDPPPPVAAIPTAPAPLWKCELGAPAWASPVIAGELIFIGTADGKFHAVHADTGKISWTWSGPHPLYADALVTDDSVLFVDDATDLVSLARSTGTLQWRLPLHDAALAGEPTPKNETFNHRATTPVIDAKGIVYVGSTDRGLYAVRAKTGKVAWRFDAKTKVYAPVTLRGDDLIVAGFDGSVIVLNRRTHEEKRRVKLGGPLVSAPTIAGNRVIVGCRDYLLYGLESGTLKPSWKNSYWFSWVESTPRVVDGTLYIGGSDFRRISAINAADGTIRWATDVGGLSWGSPVVTADVVYAGTAGQTLPGTVIQHRGGLVALDRETGKPLWRHESRVVPGTDFNGFAGSIALGPNGIIGAGVDGVLVAFPFASGNAK